jgi:hypothetical protein
MLARLARHPLLVFIDADVRLASNALVRMAAFMEQNDVASPAVCRVRNSAHFLNGC